MSDKYRSLTPNRRKHRDHYKSSGVVKRTYSEAEARRAAHQLSKREPNKKVSAYPCSVCPWWHVGTSPR